MRHGLLFVSDELFNVFTPIYAHLAVKKAVGLQAFVPISGRAKQS
jgi:hypothetical protein